MHRLAVGGQAHGISLGFSYFAIFEGSWLLVNKNIKKMEESKEGEEVFIVNLGYAWDVVQNTWGGGEQLALITPAVTNPLSFKVHINSPFPFFFPNTNNFNFNFNFFFKQRAG